jgi:hypothetical protein
MHREIVDVDIYKIHSIHIFFNILKIGSEIGYNVQLTIKEQILQKQTTRERLIN